MGEQMRLQRYLAAAGVAARRKAEQLITEGRVTVNGKIVTVLGTKIDAEHDRVTVDGEAVVPLDLFYVLFNKPKGCITAVTDDRGRPTVMDYLPNVPIPVKPVGRLDFYSEGVLLLTNDGELAARLLAPGEPRAQDLSREGPRSALAGPHQDAARRASSSTTARRRCPPRSSCCPARASTPGSRSRFTRASTARSTG